MASYPGSKVHRVNRRKLGRGQSTSFPTAGLTVTGAAELVTLTFSEPVVAKLPIAITLSAGGPVLSQTQISPTVVHIVTTSAVTGASYTVPANSAATLLGGGAAGAAGTF